MSQNKSDNSKQPVNNESTGSITEALQAGASAVVSTVNSAVESVSNAISSEIPETVPNAKKEEEKKPAEGSEKTEPGIVSSVFQSLSSALGFAPTTDSSEKPEAKEKDKPKEDKDKPKENKDKPKENKDKPKENKDKPKENKDKPKENKDKPKENKDKPKENKDKPKDNNKEPEQRKSKKKQDIQDGKQSEVAEERGDAKLEPKNKAKKIGGARVASGKKKKLKELPSNEANTEPGQLLAEGEKAGQLKCGGVPVSKEIAYEAEKREQFFDTEEVKTTHYPPKATRRYYPKKDNKAQRNVPTSVWNHHNPAPRTFNH